MKFEPSTDMFCGRSCATSYDTGASWGLGLRFTKPFIDDRPDFKLETVETSQGPIHLKLRITPCKEGFHSGEHYGKDGEIYPRNNGPEKIEHYTCSEVCSFSVCCRATVGMCLYIDHARSYEKSIEDYRKLLENPAYSYDHQFYKNQITYYENFIATNNIQKEKIEKNLEGILLYKSEPFYNLVHGERDYPSCILYIYDKELKNAIPPGV